VSQVTIERNSQSDYPTLILKETEDDFSRLNFQNVNGGVNQYWSMTGKIGTTDTTSHFRMFYGGLNPLTSDYVFSITGEKKVGIGTIDPSAKLEVFNGDLNFNSSFFLVNSLMTNFPLPPIVVKLLEVQLDRDVFVHKLGINNENPSDRLHVSATAGENAFRVTIDNTTKMRVHNNGGTSVGNNTTPPDDGLFVTGKLHVNTANGSPDYLVAINGKVICEELTMLPPGQWPDYVFDPQYHLMTLTELEEYIESNRHLPGIPSASRIASEGVHTSLLLKTLVEKVEELTLYIIAQEKRILEQEYLIKTLRN
jgi:hypothetical protein